MPQNEIGSCGPKQPSIKNHFDGLHKKCGEILTQSLTGDNAALIAKGRFFTGELDVWRDVLSSRTESELLRVATLEYEFALLSLAQGHYRQAFKGLRLVLELTLQCVYLSAKEVTLREWMQNQQDTVWGAIVENENGIFSRRFTNAFFPKLSGHALHYQTLASQIYRECSECVHGNTPKHIPLPALLDFDQAVFSLWFDKADCVALVTHYALSLRYLHDLPKNDKLKLEVPLTNRIGHIKEVRELFGGPV